MPKAYRFEGTEVFIHKIGNAVILLPQKSPWENLFQAIERFSDDYLEERVQPKTQKRSRLSAKHYGELRASLENAGKMIGSMDMMIAAHALSLEWTCVTNNEREFRRVKELKIESWTK